MTDGNNVLKHELMNYKMANSSINSSSSSSIRNMTTFFSSGGN